MNEDIDRMVEHLSIQSFRPIRSQLYAALVELRQLRADNERRMSDDAYFTDPRVQELARLAQHAQDETFKARAEQDRLAAVLADVRALVQDARSKLGAGFTGAVPFRQQGVARLLDDALAAAASIGVRDEAVKPGVCDHGRVGAACLSTFNGSKDYCDKDKT